MEIILASSSPRRKDILESLGLKFKIISPDIEEVIQPEENAVDFARRIASEKSQNVLLELQNVLPEENLIISSDTNVIIGKKILGKPKGRESAEEMLKSLRNKKHLVISAISIIYSTPRIRKKAVAHSISSVYFRDFSNEELNDYLNFGEWSDKAGGYAIQGKGSYFLNWFQGSFTSIIGFPLRLFFRILAGMEMNILSLWEETEKEI